jgi:hypothetical protein
MAANICIKTPLESRFTAAGIIGSAPATNKGILAAQLDNLLHSVLAGLHPSSPGTTDVELHVGATRASATVTLNAVVATNTLVVNGVTLTGVASGATASQFNIGATDTITADNIVATINSTSAPAGILGVVRAWRSGASAITVECIYPGTIGNAITLTGTATRFTVSSSPLAGGATGTIIRPFV